jgi:pyrrolidone-carboxylate peptidase
MASFHVFAEMDLLEGKQTDADSFGAKSADEFRLTSSFTIAKDVKAFAVVAGTVLLQQVDANSSLVNLILKPMGQSKINFPAVKYFIYRGLKKSDFISGTSVISTGSQFVLEMNDIQNKRNQTLIASGQPAQAIPLEALLGHDLNPPLSTRLDAFFFKENQTAQLHTAKIGMHLGNFNSGTKIGFEIVLENAGYFPDVAMAKKLENTITTASGATIDKRYLRETVLNFIDPAAYYGMHLDDNFRIGYRDSTNANNGDKKDRDIYELIVKKFATRNRVYLDIRNENGYTLNYYNNYQAPDAPASQEIRVGTGVPLMSKAEYYNRFGWPFYILDNPGDGITNNVYVDLPVNDNTRPLVYVEHGNISSSHKKDFIDETQLLGGPTGWTKTIGSKVQFISTASTAEKTVSTVIRLMYIKQIVSSAVPAQSVVPTKVYTDNVFGPLNQIPTWATSNALVWSGGFYKKYVDATTALDILYKASAPIVSVNILSRKFTVSGNITSHIFFNDEIFVQGSSGNDRTYKVLITNFTNINSTEITVQQNIPTSAVTGNVAFYKSQKIAGIDKASKKIIISGSNLSTEIQATHKIFLTDISGNKVLYTVQSVAFANNNTEIVLAEPLKEHGFGCVVETGVSIETNKIVFYASPLDYFNQDFPERSVLSNGFVGGTSKKDTIFRILEDFGKQLKLEFDVLVLPSINEVKLLSLQETINKNQRAPITSNFFALGLTYGSGSEFDRLITGGSGLSNFHHKFLILQETTAGSFETDISGEKFKRYEVKIAGYDASGNFAAFPASGAPVIVYSLYTNRRVFNSQNFSAALNPTPQVGLKYEEEPIDASASKAIVASILNADPQMKSLVDVFTFEINQITTFNKPAILAKILEKGRALWKLALVNAGENGSKPYDDRPLYWARLSMRKSIRNHAKLSPYLKVVDDLIKELEAISRGYDEIDFSSTPAGVKKVLVSGYDPFTLHSYPRTSNPSGSAALGIHGKMLNRVVNGNQVPVAYIQAAVFPVRYRDFDQEGGKGVVERFFEKFINSKHPQYTQVDLIMTISRASADFWVDRFASRTRGGWNDNENITNIPFPDTPQGDQFYETTLPAAKIVPATDTGSFKIYYNNSYTYKYKNGNLTVTASWSSNKDKKKIEEPPVAPGLTSIVPSKLDETTTPKKSQITAVEGSGGDYLSNEIFYRVALMRAQSQNPLLPTGHYHIPDIQGGGDFDPVRTTEMVKVIEESIKKALLP